MEDRNIELTDREKWEKMAEIEGASEDSKVAEIGLEISNLEKYFTKKSVAMIGLADQIGYSITGYNYLNQIIHSIKFQSTSLVVFNAHFRTFHKEQHIEDFIASNISLREIKRMQHQENEEKIKSILEKKHLTPDKKLMIVMRQFLRLKEPDIRKDDNQLKLRDALNQQDVNIFYSSNTGYIDKNTPLSYIIQQQEQRKRNYDYILSNNENAQIYALGLMMPNNHPDEKTIKIIENQNQYYQKLASEFGTIYVDTTGLEKTLKGNCLTEHSVSNLALCCIKAMHQRKIEHHNHTNLAIIRPTIQNSNQGVEYLIQKSKEREEDLQIQQRITQPNKDKQKSLFLQQEFELEKQHQKIYTKSLDW